MTSTLTIWTLVLFLGHPARMERMEFPDKASCAAAYVQLDSLDRHDTKIKSGVCIPQRVATEPRRGGGNHG